MKLRDLNDEMLAATITEEMIETAYQEALLLHEGVIGDAVKKAGEAVKNAAAAAVDKSTELVTTAKNCLNDLDKCSTDVGKFVRENAFLVKAYLAKQGKLLDMAVNIISEWLTKHKEAIKNNTKAEPLSEKQIEFIRGYFKYAAKIAFIIGASVVPIPGATLVILKAAQAALAPTSIYPKDEALLDLLPSLIS